MLLTSEEVLAIQDNPALLDRLSITSTNGTLWGIFGLGSELYIEPRPRQQLRLDMLTLQEDYYQRFSEHIKYCCYDSAEQFKRTSEGKCIKLKGNPFPMVRDKIGDWPNNAMYCNRLFIPYIHQNFPNSTGSITPWKSNIAVSADSDDYLTAHYCYMPVGNPKGGLHFDTLREGVLSWCQKIRPMHGQAGFTVITDGLSAEPWIYPTLQRHPGLNIIQPVNLMQSTEGVFNRIKCVNWLTVLGEEILNELGGLSAAKDALEPDCTLYPYPGGVVIQAGVAPQLGDTTVGDVPECYQKVARFTKPVRFDAYTYRWGGLFQVSKPLNGVEETLKWISRFD
ncbi:MAG: DUF3396 domain-containing protein [Proteobacteria bacterium]|nr:DUF3396 domain-containing protein [Pseudomonadota bacterium]